MCNELKYLYFKSHPLFAGIPDELIEELTAIIKVKSVACNDVMRYGESTYSRIYILLQGIIKVGEARTGEADVIKDVLLSPDVFGDLSLEGRYPKDEYAVALSANTIICSFHVNEFKLYMREYPLLAVNYTRIVNKKLNGTEGSHSILTAKDEKVALMRFIENHAQ